MIAFEPKNTLNYASSPAGTRPRYSIVVIVCFTCALLLPLVVLQAGYVQISAAPHWVLLAAPLMVFAGNIASAFHLLNAPLHVRGDALVIWGVIVSGFTALSAMLLAMCTWL